MTYEIKGRYKDFDWELIDVAADKDEGEYLLAEYMMSYGKEWDLRLHPGGFFDDDEIDRFRFHNSSGDDDEV